MYIIIAHALPFIFMKCKYQKLDIQMKYHQLIILIFKILCLPL